MSLGGERGRAAVAVNGGEEQGCTIAMHTLFISHLINRKFYETSMLILLQHKLEKPFANCSNAQRITAGTCGVAPIRRTAHLTEQDRAAAHTARGACIRLVCHNGTFFDTAPWKGVIIIRLWGRF